MKIVFMGTPDFAALALKRLIDSEHEIVLVVTQPDKPVGRKQILTPSDVKVVALEHGLEVYQPERIKRPECVEYLKKYEADLFVVAAYGQILSQEILDMPKMCCINIHASLLPKYRGSSPIQWSVVNGDKITGVTIQRMDIGVDTGDIVSVKEVEITDTDTGESMFDKLAVAGAELLMETLKTFEDGTVTYTPQNHDEATHVGMIKKEDGELDFSQSAAALECRVRGFYPWPGCYTHFDGKMLKIWATKVSDKTANGKSAGQLAFVDKNSFGIVTGDGVLEVLEVQLEGKKRMSAGDFLRGNSLGEDTIFGVS